MSQASNSAGTRRCSTCPTKITCCSSPASITIRSTSSRYMPSPTSRNRTPRSCGSIEIVSARVNTPCHGPNVPTKPARVSSSLIPSSRRTASPPAAGRNSSTSTALGFTTIFSRATPAAIRLFRSTSATTKIRMAAARFRSSHRSSKSTIRTRPQCLAIQTSEPLYSKNSGRFVFKLASTPLQLKRL